MYTTEKRFARNFSHVAQGYLRGINSMKNNIAKLATLLVSASFTASAMAISPYSQNFEGLSAGASNALSADGWLVGANVFSAGGSYLYGYFAFPAPNPGGGFSSVAGGEGGANQGSQYINVYSDYNNQGAHTAGDIVESFVFQERTFSASDIGLTYVFKFDYKASSQSGPAGATTTSAFMKVLDPANGYATIANPVMNTTMASTSVWSEGNTLSVTVDSSWTGKLLQFGFSNKASNNQASGMYYDNVSLTPVPEPATMTVLALGVAAALKRRRK
jgi:hypothetical protein